jgi:hypothetical protein
LSVHIAPPLSVEQVRDTTLHELSERTRSLLADLSGLALANDAGPAAAATAPSA